MFISLQASLSAFAAGLIDFCGTSLILFVATVLCNWGIAGLGQRLFHREPSPDFVALCSCTLFLLIGLLSGSLALFVSGAAHAVVYWSIRQYGPQIAARQGDQL